MRPARSSPCWACGSGPQVDFTRILSIARTGSSGETYACDAQGVLLSESRFDDELKQIGLLPDREDANSILDVQVRDPGVDMTAGERPTVRRSEQPLTFAAAQLAAGRSGSNVVGYRDYRGVPIDRGLGVAARIRASA